MTTINHTLKIVLDTLVKREVVQATLSLMVTLAVVVLFIAHNAVPDALLSIWTLIVGFYFGTRGANGSNAAKGG